MGNNAFGLTRYTCSWNPEWSIYNQFSFLPSLTQSLRGCCALSACVQPEGRQTQHNIPAAPVAVMEAPVGAPVVNDSTPVNIEAPVHHTKYRDRISGCDSLRYKRQFKHNIPCHQHACEYGL